MGKRTSVSTGGRTLLGALLAWAGPLMAVGAAHADDLFVPSPEFPNIQAAVDAARDGDTVVLRTGEFRGSGNLNVQITSGRFTIRGEAPTGSVIRGRGRPYSPRDRAFEITGDAVDVTLRDLEIVDCSANNVGGAVRVRGARVLIERVGFTDNAAVGDFSGFGGALSLAEATATIRDCAFRGNVASAFGGGGAGDGSGGAVWIRAGTVTFERSVFEGNFALGSDMFGNAKAGAILARDTVLTLRGCKLRANEAFAADAEGGGIHATNSVVQLVDTDLIGNVASGVEVARAGGIQADGPTVINGGRIEANRARDEKLLSACCGGYWLTGSTSMANVTISGNAALGGRWPVRRWSR